MRLTDSGGKTIVLGRKLGSGGEADIYSVDGNADLVAKVYFRRTSERPAKLHAMVGAPPPDPTAGQGHVSICWPKSLLFAQRREFVGFLMHRVDFSTSIPVFTLYNPQDRRQLAPGFTWAYLLRTAVNIARVVESVHAYGYIVGDLNESNFLVSDTALVTLVDCDSMQVPNGKGQFFRCTVGKAEFTAPELQGRNFNLIDRNPAHDNFALGVMIFQLLMEGVHPYAGVWRGRGDPPPLEARIRSGDCTYAGSSNIAPMPMALPFEFLPATIKSLVIRCFGYGQSNPATRPSPREWREGLAAVEPTLITCSANRRHVYSPHLSRCPWCERTILLRGFDPFASASPQKPLAATPLATPRLQPASPPLAAQPTTIPFPRVRQASPGFRKKAAVIGLLLMGIVVWAISDRQDNAGKVPLIPAGGSMSQAPELATANPAGLLGVPPTPPPPQHQPSFNCSQASTWDEVEVCSDASLAESDRVLAALYASLMDKAPVGRRNSLRMSQLDWLRKRRACGSAANRTLCLTEVYRQRIVRLQQEQGATEAQVGRPGGTPPGRNPSGGDSTSLYGASPPTSVSCVLPSGEVSQIPYPLCRQRAGVILSGH
jgi:uncharacterized protein YecT (DUF1311 family)